MLKPVRCALPSSQLVRYRVKMADSVFSVAQTALTIFDSLVNLLMMTCELNSLHRPGGKGLLQHQTNEPKRSPEAKCDFIAQNDANNAEL
ncbi:hypothetical protein Tcan_13708 [Toxocara canis]|uniref:Uncharacterized protein n=1 Tax=Toxocara canis TaxID=6265 RepID=A0A0B2V625_TOXCA|nr:hypothetical protein Tcan_13708 [Toxocara canis]